MGENNYRIRTDLFEDSGSHLKLNLEQDFDFIEVLSLKISQEEAYRRFCSDYGAVVGRVIVNSGFGVPNVKVSIFVPISDEDEEDPLISGLYPYANVDDTDDNGVRYNLLPKERQFDCHNPVGTFPSKREILDNDTTLEVYEKYYKYTTVTNSAGDFMLFGVPVGTHTLHVDADLSDIGYLSQKPYHFIKQGQDEKQFDSPTRFASDTNLDSLTHIKTRDVGVNVRPFWGDENDCEVGISRVDVDLQYDLQTYAMFMGSLYGDSEKNSVNKNCRPRTDVGKLCEQRTNEGRIEMIRKTEDGSIERFDVDGGDVVDENGAWAYLVPMNLDKAITDEFGNFVPSEDPNKGIATRASVRFRASMTITGQEGRLRKRAKHLIPHNPDNQSDDDYSFNEQTSDEHFRDLYMDQIYTVSNHIPRWQGNRGIDAGENNNFIGMKDCSVRDCGGSGVNPFPYNKMHSKTNPLFNVLCTILTIISTILFVINFTLIPLINGIIFVINKIVDAFNSLIDAIGNIICQCWTPLDLEILCCKDEFNDFKVGGLNYIPCLSINCEGDPYAPGCIKGSNGDQALKDNGTDANLNIGDYLKCVATTLSDALNLFRFDFYQDWVNGALYFFLFKHKEKSDGRQKFCEYNCSKFPGGVNGDGSSDQTDNDCRQNLILDTCVDNGDIDVDISIDNPTDLVTIEADASNVFEQGINSETTKVVEDGVVTYYQGELYYPPVNHDGSHKLFATDILALGSMRDCDPNGIPRVINQLEPTTFTNPPLTSQDDVTGISDLFFNVNCILGIFTDAPRYCTNLKRACELGVDLDSDPSSAKLRSDDMLDSLLDRKVITYYNTPSINNGPQSSFQDVDTKIGDSMKYFKDFSDNESDYVKYRGKLTKAFVQFERSYYFYFGLIPGNSALDKAIVNFFAPCEVPEEQDIIIEGDVTDVTFFGGSDGEIDITSVDGGVSPYTYNWKGPSNFSSSNRDLTGLGAGTYILEVTDNEGNEGTAVFQVGQPPPIVCDHEKDDESKPSSNDGSITVDSIGGGTPNYTVTLYEGGKCGSSNLTFVTDETIPGPSGNDSDVEFNNLSDGEYCYIVEDSTPSSNGGPLVCKGSVEIEEPPVLSFEINNVEDVTCFGNKDGSFDINVTSQSTNQVSPYSFEVEDSSGTVVSNSNNPIGLEGGTYTVTVTDDIGQSKTKQVTIDEPPKLEIKNSDVTPAYCPIADDSSEAGKIEFEVDGGTSFNCSQGSHGRDYKVFVTRPDDYGGESYSEIELKHTNFYDNNKNPLKVDIDNMGIVEGCKYKTSQGFSYDPTKCWPEGNYRFRIVDCNGCEYIDNIQFEVPDPIVIFPQKTGNVEITVILGGGNPDENYANNGRYHYDVFSAGCDGLGNTSNVKSGFLPNGINEFKIGQTDLRNYNCDNETFIITVYDTRAGSGKCDSTECFTVYYNDDVDNTINNIEVGSDSQYCLGY